MLIVLAAEKGGAKSLDLHHQAISEPHRTMDVEVDLGEHRYATDHMVCGTYVEHPSASLDLLLVVELHKDFILHQMNILLRRWWCLGNLWLLEPIGRRRPWRNIYGWRHLRCRWWRGKDLNFSCNKSHLQQ
jgi:hypothetical protein